MTNTSSNQSPDQRPEQGREKGPESPRGVYNPITIGGDQKQERNWPGEFESPVVRLFVALLFTVIFAIAWNRPEFGSLTVIVLAGCLLQRLESWQRRIAAAPLILAAIRLCLLLPAYAADWTPRLNPFNGTPNHTPGGDFGMPWLPAFLSVCLFYLPRKDSVTLKIVVVEALAVILSSLLPGEGFISILAIFHYTLFFAVTIGLILDLKPSLRALFSNPVYDGAPVAVRIHSTPPPRRPGV